MQVDPIEPKLRPSGTKRLKLQCVVLLLTSAFNFSLRRYTTGGVMNLPHGSTVVDYAFYTDTGLDMVQAKAGVMADPTGFRDLSNPTRRFWAISDQSKLVSGYDLLIRRTPIYR